MIEIEHLEKTFHLKKKEVDAVNDVSLKINDGEVYGIIGYSGAGKSTLVRCINFLEIPDNGSITINDFGTISVKNQKLYLTNGDKTSELTEKKLRELRRSIGMIFQHFNLLDRCTVFENIAYPLQYTRKSKAEISKKVRSLLELVALEDKIDSYPSQLSGGQKQRVAIARALANDPKILLCDEATSALDPDATESILKLLQELNQKLNLTIILITHEMSVVKTICQKVAVIEEGKVVEEGDVYNIFAHPKKDITKRFVSTSSGLGDIHKLLRSNPDVVQLKDDSKLIKLTFEKDCVGEALISDASRKYNVNFNIVLANVDLVQDIPLGEMIVIVSGETSNVVEALKYFESCNVRVEEVQA